MAELVPPPATVLPIDLPPADTIFGALLRKLADVRPEIDGWTCTCPSPEHDGKQIRGFVYKTVGGEPGYFCDDGCDADAVRDVLFPRAELSVKDYERTALESRALVLTTDGLRTAPPPRRYLLVDANTGMGTFVAGKVGLLAAAGGSGKSWALMQLTVAVASGTTWFGARGWSPVEPGRVLYLAGEEDREEMERRLHHAVRAQGASSDDGLTLLKKNLTAIPLHGVGCALTGEDTGSSLPLTRFWTQVHELAVLAVEEGRPYSLIVLDPLSRFAGFDVEKDNAAATRWVQAVELLSEAAGGASIWCAHHTKKRGENDDPTSADLIRGASALVNGVRWAARLEQQKQDEDSADLLTLRIVKANGVPPQVSPLILCRDQEHEGALRVATPAEIASHEGVTKMVKSKVQQLGEYRERILAVMIEDRVYSKNEIVRACGKRTLTLASITSMIDDGELVQVGSGPRDPRAGVRRRRSGELVPTGSRVGNQLGIADVELVPAAPTPPVGGWGREPVQAMAPVKLVPT